MRENADHVLDDLAAYALGSLEPAQHERIDRHVRVCVACAGHLGEYRGVVGVLPVALAPVAPPADVWTTIRAELRARDTAGASARRPTFRRWLPVTGWLTAAALAAVLITWNLHLHTQLAQQAQGPQVEKLARRPERLIVLTGGAAQPHASARVFAAVDGQSGHMAVTGLPMLPPDRVYQLWFLPKTQAAIHNAATFNVDSDGRAWVVIRVPIPLDDTRVLIVTADPAGSSTPVGPPLLEAVHWR